MIFQRRQIAAMKVDWKNRKNSQHSTDCIHCMTLVTAGDSFNILKF